MDNQKSRIAKLVKLARGGMSQRAFGIDLGVSSTAVQHWENGVAMPSASSLFKIAARAGYTFEDVQAYLDGQELPDVDVTAQIIKSIQNLSLNQIAIIDRAMADRLMAIAESAA
jgi:transcriptional regulator with XRE-family HTH domain